MGLDAYQVTNAYWNRTHQDPVSKNSSQNTKVYAKNFRTDAQLQVGPALTENFYSSTWFRALNDIRKSETFMSLLESVYWDLKLDFTRNNYDKGSKIPVDSSEVVYEFDLGSVIPKSYFLEVRFNFNADEIQLGIGQHL
tara:strand:+ start:728 stop:1144 length:417 start_codon:yes stop_codon:yes gene_type:complete